MGEIILKMDPDGLRNRYAERQYCDKAASEIHKTRLHMMSAAGAESYYLRALLGASVCRAYDIDPLAVRVAKRTSGITVSATE